MVLLLLLTTLVCVNAFGDIVVCELTPLLLPMLEDEEEEEEDEELVRRPRAA